MADFPAIPRFLPPLLSVVAGYVDSCTFLALFGLFVAQVTGSFVLTGTQLVVHEDAGLIKLIGIPVFFVACAVTTLIVDGIGRRGRSALAAALGLETVLLLGLFTCWLVAGPFRGPNTAAAIVASVFGLFAMGVQSALTRLVAKGVPSTNVMTTNTSQFAIDTTELVLAWRAHRRSPADAVAADALASALGRFNTIWPVVLGFVVGTITGALGYEHFGMWCILAPIALAGGLAAWASGGGKTSG